MQASLSREHAGVLGRLGLGLREHHARLAQPAGADEGVAQADQRVQVLRVGGDDRLVDADRPVGVPIQAWSRPIQTRASTSSGLAAASA